ncbi:hypothetical protein PM082_011480 [Marasmius tenuissimus]|nr:hypothetical protein PM082_011480 [Marasmius tenuissimus]
MSSTAPDVSDTYRTFVEGEYKLGILVPVIVSSAHLFLYGLNVLLFRVGLVVLKKREREIEGGIHRLFHISLVSLFVLSSVGVPISLVWDIFKTREALCSIARLGCALKMRIVLGALDICRVVIVLFISFIVDMILVFRCFAICEWRRKKYAIILIVCCLITDVTATVFAIWTFGTRIHSRQIHSDATTRVSLPINSLFLEVFPVACVCLHLLANVVLTVIIAFKILQSGIAKTPNRFRTIVILLIESCALYIAAWMLFLTYGSLKQGTEVTSILIQVAGLAPTLLIVRANINKEKQEQSVALSIRNATVTPVLPVEEEIILDISRNLSHGSRV